MEWTKGNYATVYKHHTHEGDSNPFSKIFVDEMIFIIKSIYKTLILWEQFGDQFPSVKILHKWDQIHL